MTQDNLDTRFQQGISAYTQKSASITQPPMRPSNASIAPSSNFANDLDARVQQHVRGFVQQHYGVARPRSLTISIPLCGAAPPPQGWFTSFNVYQYIRIAGWTITALGQGQISIDLQVSQVQPDQATPPILTSLLNGNQVSAADTIALATTTSTTNAADLGGGGTPGDTTTGDTTTGDTTTGDTTTGDTTTGDTGGALGIPGGLYITLNGYTAFSFDTTTWVAAGGMRDITPPSCIHVIINQAVNITNASLGLYLIDLYSKVLPI